LSKFYSCVLQQAKISKENLALQQLKKEIEQERAGPASDSENSGKEETAKVKELKTKMDRMYARKNNDVLSEAYNKLTARDLLSDSDDDDETGEKEVCFFTISYAPDYS
jgi:hypothetical protein